MKISKFQVNQEYECLFVFFTTSVKLNNAEANVVVALFSSANLVEAAGRLGITYGTARKHLKCIFEKMETFLRSEAVTTYSWVMSTRWFRSLYRGAYQGGRQDYLIEICTGVIKQECIQRLADALTRRISYVLLGQGEEINEKLGVIEEIEKAVFAVFTRQTENVRPVRVRRCRDKEELSSCMTRYLRAGPFKLTGDMGAVREVQNIKEAVEVLPSLTAPHWWGVLVAELEEKSGWIPSLRIYFIPPSKT